MSLEWVPFVAAPAGAIVGATATWFASRPRLGVVIDRISISPSTYATFSPAVIDGDLQVAIEELPFQLPTISGVASPENTYVNYLVLLQQQFEEQRANFVVASKLSEEMRQLAAIEDFDRLITRYKSQQMNLYTWAEGRERQGSPVFKNSEPLGGSTGLKLALHEVEDGFVVQIPGTLNLAFLVNMERAPHVVEHSRKFAHRTARAFAAHDRQDLVDYFDGIRDAIDRTISTMDSIRTQLDKEMDRLARLEIDFLVSNTGRTGASIGPSAKADVFLKGYIPASEKDKGSAASDIFIPLTILSEDQASDRRTRARQLTRSDLRLEESNPIVIQPGETRRLVGVSSFRLEEVGDSSALRSAYSAAERMLSLTVTRFQQPSPLSFKKSPHKLITSGRTLFRDLRGRHNP